MHPVSCTNTDHDVKDLVNHRMDIMKLNFFIFNIMTSQILKFVNFRKTQKSRYLENETLFFLQLKKFINYASQATL